MYSGLIIGICLAFLMKRSRLCFAGSLRDIYMERKPRNFSFLFIVFSLQGLIYYVLVYTNILPSLKIKSFSLTATILGGLIFGFGAVLANGCSVSMLLKAGDGRINGLVGVITFIVVVVASKSGLLSGVVKSLQSQAKIEDGLAQNLPFSPLWIFILLSIIGVYLVVKSLKTSNKINSFLPRQYKGFKHIMLERNWDKNLACLIIGVLAGFSFLIMYMVQGKGGWGITTPIYSWGHAIVDNKFSFNWGSFFVLGIVVGSFITSVIGKEFSIKIGDAKSIVLQIIGTAFMAFGAVLAQGCLVGFGMTGVAKFSLQGIIGIIAIIFGLWLGAFVVYRPGRFRR